ncbi:unnamed protein product [Caretta caretta]
MGKLLWTIKHVVNIWGFGGQDLLVLSILLNLNWNYYLTRFAGMGNLLKVLTREIENYPHFFLDFEKKTLQSLLESLTCPPYTPTQHLEREQALAKEFAEILHFTLRFDELKNKTLPIENTTDCLSTMASVCKVMLETPFTTKHLNDESTSKQIRALLQ